MLLRLYVLLVAMLTRSRTNRVHTRIRSAISIIVCINNRIRSIRIRIISRCTIHGVVGIHIIVDDKHYRIRIVIRIRRRRRIHNGMTIGNCQCTSISHNHHHILRVANMSVLANGCIVSFVLALRLDCECVLNTIVHSAQHDHCHVYSNSYAYGRSNYYTNVRQ